MLNISKKEYDIIDCLEEVAKNYQSHNRGIEGLSTLLKRIILSLNEVDKVYRDSLFACWSGIEQSYAIMCMGNREHLNQEESKIIDDDINEIIKLCSELKKKYAYEEDDLYPSSI